MSKVIASFVVSDYASAAAAVSAGRRMVSVVIAFLEAEGAFSDDKEKAAKAAAAYKTARLPYIARDRDERAGDVENTAIRSLALDSAMVRALPANDPLKVARAAVQNCARVDWSWIQAQYKDAQKAAAAESGDAQAGKSEKDLLATFADFAKSATSRNSRALWIDAGTMSLYLEKCRKELATMLEGRTKV
jgi:RecA/RadA recombinase